MACKRVDRKAYDTTGRGEAASIRSSPRWRKLSAWYRARHPLCADPFGWHGELGALAEQVHHIRPLAEYPDLAYEPSNLASLCTRCHGRIEGMERAGQSTQHLFTRQNLPT